MVFMICGAILSIIYLTQKDVQGKVVTTIFPIYDICREIMGSDDELVLLEDNGSDMHSYNPTPSDIATISKAELFILVGGESDSNIINAVISANNVNLQILTLMEVENLNKLTENNDNILSSNHDHDHEHENGEVYDEHIWLSIKNAIVITESIRDSLIQTFPGKQEIYKQNAEEYINKLKKLDNAYTESIANKSDTIIIADRFPFRYLVNDYKINYYALFSGCSTETQASAESIATLIDKINENNINYIFVLETSNKAIANSIINNNSVGTDLKILVINSCQTVSQSTMQSASYLQIMTENLNILKKAIKQ